MKTKKLPITISVTIIPETIKIKHRTFNYVDYIVNKKLNWVFVNFNSTVYLNHYHYGCYRAAVRNAVLTYPFSSTSDTDLISEINPYNSTSVSNLLVMYHLITSIA